MLQQQFYLKETIYYNPVLKTRRSVPTSTINNNLPAVLQIRETAAIRVRVAICFG